MSKVVEYFGLPGVGKSTQLNSGGYCDKLNAIPHKVPLGRDKDKLKNTFVGLYSHPKLFFYLLVASTSNLSTFDVKLSIRPIFVVLERIGRYKKIQNLLDNKDIHVDEGPLQFVWRVFYEKEISKSNIKLLKRCLECLSFEEKMVVYFRCNKIKHYNRLISRNKNQPFDQNIIKGNKLDYDRGRRWMAYVLKCMKDNKIPLTSISI